MQFIGLSSVYYCGYIIFAGMRSIKLILFQLLLILGAATGFAQSNNATLYGKITDEAGKPCDMVNISIKNSSIGTVSNRNGEYLLRIPAKKPIVIVFSSRLPDRWRKI